MASKRGAFLRTDTIFNFDDSQTIREQHDLT